MQKLRDGVAPTDIARSLHVSRQTVYRYKHAASQQGAAVPRPLPQGGFRSALLDRAQIVGLAQLLLAAPKQTIRELKRAAVACGLIDATCVPSDSVIYRTIRKTALRH